MSTQKPPKVTKMKTEKTLAKKSGPKIVGSRTKFNPSVTPSSREYLIRQSKDTFTKKARTEGYRSRAAYKLKFIQDKHNMIKPNSVVVDLGAAPGGWCQVVLDVLNMHGKLVAMDILHMDPIAGVDIIRGDFTKDTVQDRLDEALKGRAVDVVISDMAPNTTGSSGADHLRIMMLVEMALEFALKRLKPGGHFACKLFMGGEEMAFRDTLRQHFDKVQFEKPDSSRKDSRETFIVALGRKAD